MTRASDLTASAASSAQTIPEIQPHSNVVANSVRFVRDHWRRFAAISAIVLTPCFWHRYIIAADLGSHLYNAWLAELIERGQAPGLWIAHQHTNVLFDLLLDRLGKVFGLAAAGKITVLLCVLIFFWSMFALIFAATRHAPWFLTPCLAMLTYGYTFAMGFFNYYISVGLAFLGLAIFWRGRGWERLIPLALAPLIVLAHPLGLLLLVTGCAYLGIVEAVRPRYQIFVFLVGIALLFAFHHYLWNHFSVGAETDPFYMFNGADQLALFGGRYRIPERALETFAVAAIALDLFRRRFEHGVWKAYLIPLQMYALLLLAVPLLPTSIQISDNVAELALLTERLTSVTAAIGCCLLGAMRPSKWHLVALLAIAGVFFTFLYQDTGTINRMEGEIERLVGTLPPGQRVMGTINPLDDSRVTIQHILDLACIGRCFSYGNYEPGTGGFRVRARPDNPYVLSSYDLAVEMEDGEYVVQPQDLPVYQIYQCSESGTDLCIHALAAGEKNDSVGIHPDN